MKPRRYSVLSLRTGVTQSFTGGKEAAEKAKALENELEAFESTSDPVCPKCGQVRENIIRHLKRTESAYGIVEGRLLWLDVAEDSLRCRLQPSTGNPIWCKYDEELVDQIIKNARGFVQARGEVKYDSTTNMIESIYIKDIEPIEEAMAHNSSIIPLSSFWKGKNFEELAIEQKVYPVENPQNLSGDWPEDADFDSFFAAVRSARD